MVVIASFVINMLLLRREDADSDIEIGGFETISISAVAKAFDFIVIVLSLVMHMTNNMHYIYMMYTTYNVKW